MCYYHVIYISKKFAFKTKILRKYYDNSLIDHFNVNKTINLIQKKFYWKLLRTIHTADRISEHEFWFEPTSDLTSHTVYNFANFQFNNHNQLLFIQSNHMHLHFHLVIYHMLNKNTWKKNIEKYVKNCVIC